MLVEVDDSQILAVRLAGRLVAVGRGHGPAVLVAFFVAFANDAVCIILVFLRVHAVDFLQHVVLKEVYQRVAIAASEEQVIVIMA